MTRPLISIIIPVYNVAPYLARCVDSVLAQRYANLEIILIDDGSTDESGSMCDEYALKDDRIRVLHKPNGGLSDARNAGLDVMTGEYVTCIDSDDFVSPWYVENLYTAISHTGCDMASSWFVNYHQGDALPDASAAFPDDAMILSREEYYRRMLYQDGVEVSAYCKLYRTSHFQDVRYPVGKLYEDIPTTYRLVEQAETIALLPHTDYCYFMRDSSIARSAFHPRKMDAVTHMNAFCSFIKEHYPALALAADCRYFSAVCNILFLISGNEYPSERKQLWREIKRLRKHILFDHDGRKKARFAAAISYAGYRVMRFVYQMLQR